MSKKLIAVQVFYPFLIYGVESSEVYEISFESGTGEQDLSIITSQLKIKCAELSKLLVDNHAIFTRESTFVNGLWSVIGERSPVKDKVLIKCNFKPKKLFDGDQASGISPKGTTSSPTMTKNPCSNRTESNCSIIGGENGGIPSSSIIATCLDESGIAYVDEQVGSECFGDGEIKMINNGTLQVTVGQACEEGSSSAVKPAGKKRSHGSLSVKTTIPTNFKLPTAFNDALQRKLDDAEEVLWPDEKAELLREVRKSLWVHTKEPSTVDLQFVVRKLVEKYCNLIQVQENKEMEIHAMITDLRRKFQRERAKQANDKSGPPIKRKQPLVVNLTPGGKKISSEFDTVSYDSNVQIMVENFDKKKEMDANTIQVLMEHTFVGRRAEIEHQDFNSVIKTYISRKCPFLIESCHLYAEMDRMKGSGICARFRQAWMDIVPAILFAAKSRKTPAVVKFLRLPRFENMKEDFDVQSRAAMELLPILMVGNKTGPQARRHFVDYREDTASLSASLIDVKDRTKPFILSIGGPLHLIVDSDLFMRADTSSEALLMLMCSYFVYNFRYSDFVLPTLLFLQSQCLGLHDDVTPKYGSVATLVKVVDKFKLDNANEK